jgi:uncharacterized RDD family membrane protein YckC
VATADGPSMPPTWSPDSYPARPVAPRRHYASWSRRVASAVIDFYVFAIPAGILLASHQRIVGICFAVAAFSWGFFNAYQAGVTGQSTGKRVMGTKLLSDVDEKVIGGRAGVLRCALHVIDSAPMNLGYLFPLWDAKRQTISDKVVNTIVVLI